MNLVRASLRLDAQLARSRHLPLSVRTGFLATKQSAVLALLRGHPARLRMAGLELELQSLSDLGTLQSAIVDVQHELVDSGVLHPGSRPRVIDVGANIGQFAAAVLLAAPAARIHCFEPNPDSCKRLAANLGAAVTVDRHALLDHTGTDVLHRHTLSVLSSLRPQRIDGYTDTIDVPVTTLDAAMPDDDSVDLLKIDVEGAEWEVLAGAATTLRRTHFLVIEISLGRGTRHTNLDVLDLVRDTCPAARIIRTGRPLGPPNRPTCQDILIDLRPE